MLVTGIFNSENGNMKEGDNITEKKITRKWTHFNINWAENKMKISIQNPCALPATQNWQNHPAILWFPCLFWNPAHTEALLERVLWRLRVNSPPYPPHVPHSSVCAPSHKASPLHNFPLSSFLPNSQEPVTTCELANIPFHPPLFRGLVKQWNSWVYMEELLSCWVFYCLDQSVPSCCFLNYEKVANVIQWLSPP